MKKLAAVLIAVVMMASISACGARKSGGADSDFYGKYTYSAEASEITSTVILNENGTFVFEFSQLSSYVGRGKYTMKDDILTLTTDDGQYHYTFKSQDGTLVFDAENSSEQLWFGEFSDGAVFE